MNQNGRGKTYLFNTFYLWSKSAQLNTITVASTGVASLQLFDGSTAHRALHLPLFTDITTFCNINKESKQAEILRKLDILIWDESPMQNRNDFETFDRTCRDIRSCNKAYGGLFVIHGGDMSQNCPVVKPFSRDKAVEASIVSSYIWPLLTKHHLYEDIRQAHDPGLSNLQTQIANGTIGEVEDAIGQFKFPLITIYLLILLFLL